MRTAWRVVATYQDGERVVESPRFVNKLFAEQALESVRRWREDQDEMPRLELEEVPYGREEDGMSEGAIIKTAVPCACAGSCGCVILVDFEEWAQEPRQVYVEFSVGYRQRFRDRAKAAWRIVRGRDPWFHAVCLYNDGAEKVAAALRGRAGVAERRTG